VGDHNFYERTFNAVYTYLQDRGEEVESIQALMSDAVERMHQAALIML
jgi:hypothetical protein